MNRGGGCWTTTEKTKHPLARSSKTRRKKNEWDLSCGVKIPSLCVTSGPPPAGRPPRRGGTSRPASPRIIGKIGRADRRRKEAAILHYSHIVGERIGGPRLSELLPPPPRYFFFSSAASPHWSSPHAPASCHSFVSCDAFRDRNFILFRFIIFFSPRISCVPIRWRDSRRHRETGASPPAGGTASKNNCTYTIPRQLSCFQLRERESWGICGAMRPENY